MNALTGPEAFARFQRLSPKEREAIVANAHKAAKENIKTSYGAWCSYALAQRGFAPQKHHRLIIDKVQSVVDGTGPKRLLIHAPPGSAKSTYTSELLPPFLLNRKRNFNLIGASNTATLAEDFSQRAQGLMDQNQLVLSATIKKRSAELWTTTNGGRYRAAGVGVAIAGNRADGVLIDDPVRSKKDADSETNRETVWNWFITDLRTRLKPDAWIIVIMTRWHEDDLGGRLLDRQQDAGWEVLNMPAIAYGPDADGNVPVDVLGRQPGEWLWEGDDGYRYANALREVKHEYEQAGASREWESLYQQNPTPGEGTVFKTGHLSTLLTTPHLTPHIVRAWDFAATDAESGGDPDWTVGVKLMRTDDNRYVVLDVVRVRGGPEVVERTIKETAIADGRSVKIGIAQDPGAAGKAYAATLVAMLSGWRVEVSPEMGEKDVRAAPVAAQCNIGNLSMVPAPWNGAFKSELTAFPAGKKDDQVDALSRAFSMVNLNRPLVVSKEALNDVRYGLRRKG